MQIRLRKLKEEQDKLKKIQFQKLKTEKIKQEQLRLQKIKNDEKTLMDLEKNEFNKKKLQQDNFKEKNIQRINQIKIQTDQKILKKIKEEQDRLKLLKNNKNDQITQNFQIIQKIQKEENIKEKNNKIPHVINESNSNLLKFNNPNQIPIKKVSNPKQVQFKNLNQTLQSNKIPIKTVLNSKKEKYKKISQSLKSNELPLNLNNSIINKNQIKKQSSNTSSKLLGIKEYTYDKNGNRILYIRRDSSLLKEKRTVHIDHSKIKNVELLLSNDFSDKNILRNKFQKTSFEKNVRKFGSRSPIQIRRITKAEFDKSIKYSKSPNVNRNNCYSPNISFQKNSVNDNSEKSIQNYDFKQPVHLKNLNFIGNLNSSVNSQYNNNSRIMNLNGPNVQKNYQNNNLNRIPQNYNMNIQKNNFIKNTRNNNLIRPPPNIKKNPLLMKFKKSPSPVGKKNSPFQKMAPKKLNPSLNYSNFSNQSKSPLYSRIQNYNPPIKNETYSKNVYLPKNEIVNNLNDSRFSLYNENKKKAPHTKKNNKVFLKNQNGFQQIPRDLQKIYFKK